MEEFLELGGAQVLVVGVSVPAFPPSAVFRSHKACALPAIFYAPPM